MGRNADAFTVVWCPDDEEYGEPLFFADQYPAFGVVQFALSLHNGVWPLGMVVEHEGEEWMVVPGTNEKGRAIQVIVSESDVVEGPVSSGNYLMEYTWMMKRRQAKPRGVNPRHATITEEEAVEIHDRYLYSDERPTQFELAGEYGIGQKQVSNIVREIAWSYLWN